MTRFKVQAGEGGSRADVFVASKYPDYTRSALQRLFDEKMVRLGGQPVKSGTRLADGDELKIDETYLHAEPPRIDIPIIYEDDDVLVLDKPAGLLSHSKGALNLEASVASFIASKITDKELAGNRAGIVHRLDRGTSGVIITAKTKAAQTWLQTQFSKRKAKKTYLAIVKGVPEPKEAIIDAPIMRDPARPQSFKVGRTGKNAITHYLVLKSAKKGSATYSLVELKPLTGRTHQLRVHMTYTGHAITGDNVYGKGDGQIMLHAHSLELTLLSGERRKFIAKTPSRIMDFFND